MSYCQIHHMNNCIECAIENQTKQIVAAIKGTSNTAVSPEQPSTRSIKKDLRLGLSESAAIENHFFRMRSRWPCWFSFHDWRIAAMEVTLDAGTSIERRCNILRCKLCPKTKVSYGDYPPRPWPRSPKE